jgi:subtilisin family serine protease
MKQISQHISQRFTSTCLVVVTLITAACAGAAPVSTAPKAPQRAPVNSSPLPAPSLGGAIVLKKFTVAPPGWQRLSIETDSVFGTGSDRALRELLNGRQPTRRVIVAVVDGGVDTANVLLKANLWRNAKEATDGRDDDGDGLIDDVRGWNFIGGPNMKSLNFETLEVTRELAACRGLPAGMGMPKPDAAQCEKIKNDYDKQRSTYAQQSAQVANITGVEGQVRTVLEGALRTQNLTRRDVYAFAPTSDMLTQARGIWLQLNDQGLTGQALVDARVDIDSTLAYGFDLNSTQRAVVGDSVGNVHQRIYGNADVTGPDAKHGTHVAGIIGATRGPDGVQGIDPFAQIMSVRTVPNGDERDKDIANAIRYAADHGANIINMSFGKGYSPEKATVDDAVKYAQGKGVLFVHAAGNDGANNDSVPSFPSPDFLDHTHATSWIDVGASSWQSLDQLAAPFSNYGHNNVDLFAPGVDVLSTVLGNHTERLSGTSMASPVVSGVAALLMSYFPQLTAAEVKDILVKSARTVKDSVTIPGGASKVPFTALSRSGGVVDAYAAVKMAMERTGSAKK